MTHSQLDEEAPAIKFHLPLHMGGTRRSRRSKRHLTTAELFDNLEDATHNLFDKTPITHQKSAKHGDSPCDLRAEQYDVVMGALYEGRVATEHQRAETYEDEMVLYYTNK